MDFDAVETTPAAQAQSQLELPKVDLKMVKLD
jgi:hypothetical protein